MKPTTHINPLARSRIRGVGKIFNATILNRVGWGRLRGTYHVHKGTNNSIPRRPPPHLARLALWTFIKRASLPARTDAICQQQCSRGLGYESTEVSWLWVTAWLLMFRDGHVDGFAWRAREQNGVRRGGFREWLHAHVHESRTRFYTTCHLLKWQVTVQYGTLFNILYGLSDSDTGRRLWAFREHLRCLYHTAQHKQRSKCISLLTDISSIIQHIFILMFIEPCIIVIVEE